MLFLIITAKLLKLSNESSLDQHHIRVSILGKHKHTGDAYIIWIHEGLYFGERLPGHSLVNPNQLKHNGRQVQDNPYDTKNLMSIQGDDANENNFLFHYYQKVLIYVLTFAHLLILKLTHVLMFILLTN